MLNVKQIKRINDGAKNKLVEILNSYGISMMNDENIFELANAIDCEISSLVTQKESEGLLIDEYRLSCLDFLSDLISDCDDYDEINRLLFD